MEKPAPALEPGPASLGRARWRVSRRIVFGILLAGLLVLVHQLYQGFATGNPAIRGAFFGGTAAAIGTALGTLPVLLSRPFSRRAIDSMLGFGAGVMLAASCFSLILPALAVARAQGSGAIGASVLVGAGIVLGAALLFALDRLVPHEHFIKGVEGARARALKRVWLFVLAIAVHNFPEGLSIGVAFAGPNQVGAQSLALGIAIQDIPEGLVVALALLSVGYSRALAIGVGILSGMIEIVGAVLGAVIVSVSAVLLPWGLAAAAGAMLFVVSHEIIPESHRKGHEANATGGLLLGFVVMLILDTALG